MKFKVVLPLGVEKKTLFVNDSTIVITEGQIVTNDILQKQYPQFFEEITEGTKKAEVIVETKPKEEPKEELLIEQPERVVEVEIVADEPATEEVIAEEAPVAPVVEEAPAKKAPAKKTTKK